MKKLIVALCICCFAAAAICVVPQSIALAEITTTETDSYVRVNTLPVEELVQERLGAGDYTYEYIFGFEDIDRYILVEGDNKYMIFDTAIQDFLECSTESNSPYWSIPENFEKIYFAPTFYFYFVDGTYYDLQTDIALTSAEVEQYITAEEQKEAEYLQKLNAALVNHSVQVSNSAKIVAAETSNSVPYANYFRHLVNNKGNSVSSNDVGYVALGMLLSYYDTVCYDNLIGDNFEVKVNKSFNSFSSISADNYTESPGVNESFQNFLINYGINNGISNANTAENIAALIGVYGNYVGVGNCGIYGNEGVLGECISLIDDGCPVLVGVTGQGLQYAHSVVAYAYQDGALIANTGSRQSGQSAVLLSAYSYEFYVYADLYTSHGCSDNYQWSCNGSTGTVCPCGQITCNHEAGTQVVSAGSTKHNYACKTCGKALSSGYHNFTFANGVETCSVCNYSQAHTLHSYTYTPLKVSRHKATCTTCGGTKTEACTPVNASIMSTQAVVESYCMFCGQQLPVLNSSLAAQQQIAETFRALATPQLPAMQ